MTIALGSKVRDMISGFEGIATGHCDYLYGCSQYLIAPDRLGDKGELLDSQWFDEQRVEVVEARVIPFAEHATAVAGGPQRDAPRGRR